MRPIQAPMNCLTGEWWQPQPIARSRISAGEGPRMDVNRYIVQKGLDRRLVLYWYQSHGRVVASEYWSRAYLVLDSLRFHRSDGALVRVITPIRDSDARAERNAIDFIRALFPVLNRHLPG